MALKSLLVFAIVCILAAVGAAPMAEAQLGGIIGSIFKLIRIVGNLFCTENGNMGVNGTATPVFPNATVQLQCGAGNVISSATTNSAGEFSILLDPLQFLVSSLLNCNLVVNTPLSTCNSAFTSSGILLSPLKLIGSTVQGFLTITNMMPSAFTFLPFT